MRLRRPLVLPAAIAVAIAGLGMVVSTAVANESAGALDAAGGWETFVGQLCGLTGAYLMLLMVLLVSRLVWVERAVGQDRLVRWHRNLGQWPVYLITLHVIFITSGYAAGDKTGVLHQFWVFVRSYPDVLMAIVAFGLIVAGAVTSIRQARRRMRYETWWSLHLYMYLGLALAFAHQIANGQSFVGHPLSRVLWSVLWAGTAGVVLAFRVGLPLARTAYHGLRVERVTVEGPGVISVICRGRHLDRLGVEGGHFFQWRFMARGLMWQAHPYSVSALPRPGFIRITVKDLGDHSRSLARLRPGTRVLIEGPYGAFTRRAITSDRVLLIGAGVGVTPIRALLEHLDPGLDTVVILRASETEGLLRSEFAALMKNRRKALLLDLVGPRAQHPMDARRLALLVPDIAQRDVYVCGPESLNETVVSSARRLGVPSRRIHCEQFAF